MNIQQGRPKGIVEREGGEFSCLGIYQFWQAQFFSGAPNCLTAKLLRCC